MKTGQASRTADAAAVARARHLLHRSGPTVFEDPYAIHLTSPAWRRVLQNPVLEWLVFRNLLWGVRAGGAQILARARYVEDKLDVAIKAGVRQYVIVGAGLDSFALRRPDLGDTVKVFELDHPSTQAVKQSRLRALVRAVPGNLAFVPIDFERLSIRDALGHSAFDPGNAAFFSWLGTTYYLTPEATRVALGSLASSACRGSELVFDYMVPAELVPESEALLVRRIKRATAWLGDPMISSLDPKHLAEHCSALGFTVLEDVSGQELGTRYFGGTTDEGFRPPAATRVVHLHLRAPAEGASQFA